MLSPARALGFFSLAELFPAALVFRISYTAEQNCWTRIIVGLSALSFDLRFQVPGAKYWLALRLLLVRCETLGTIKLCLFKQRAEASGVRVVHTT